MLKIGSIWRKWDFHVHTPYSLLNNGFGNSEKDETWDKYVCSLFNKALELSVKVIFITDYFLIDGYQKILSIINDETKLNTIFKEEIGKDRDYLKKIKSISLFPNIEFRTSNQIEESKIQYHVLFSNELKPEIIKKHFLEKLSVDMDGTKYYLSLDEIQKYGEVCKQKGIGVGIGNNPLTIGLNCAYVDLEKAKAILSSDSLFNGKYIFVAAEEDVNHISWAGQTGSLRRQLYNEASARFSAAPSDIKWGLNQECINTIGHKLPSLWGSDSHDYDSLLMPSSDHFCWIKADKTFKGLLDAIEIPEDRIFIGAIPPELLKHQTRKGYSIKSVIVFGNTDDSKNHWINASIPLNPSMISIIGNKGSGKSALSDILGFLGNSSKYEHFSFLNSDRFFDKTNPFAKDYIGNLVFYDNSETESQMIKLKGYDESSPELVTYLPQRYIEKTCNEVDKQFFVREINRLIFSYLDDVDKEGFDNLEDLIEFRFKDIDDKISTIRYEISELNIQIVKKERMKTSQYGRELAVAKKELEKRIENHRLSKPVELSKPQSEESNPLFDLLEQCNELLESTKQKHHEQFLLYKKKSDEIESIKNLDKRVDELKAETTIINSQYSEHFATYNSSLAYSIGVSSNSDTELKKYKDNLFKDYSSIKETLYKNENVVEHFDLTTVSMEIVKSKINGVKRFFEKEDILNTLIDDISNSIGSEQAAYQQNQEDIKKWNAELNRLENGSDENQNEGSLKHILGKITYVNENLDGDLDILKEQRKEKVTELFALLVSKKDKLKGLYAPVQSKLNAILDNDCDTVSFDCRINNNPALSKTIDDKINHRVSSTFKDYSDLVDLVNSTDFNDSDSTIRFADTIIGKVDNDLDLFYQGLLKESDGQKDFYNFISCLSYLDVQYSLKMNDKTLEQLSPGEKGIVLLIFYLALDKNNKPLVIDQPEDNLDNESIYKKLTKLIKYAKQNRQIIVVTHNPNIAVACDSEQIIYASIEQGTNIIKYESGSIEDPIMSKHIVDVLEGTMPAFNYRESKYRKI